MAQIREIKRRIKSITNTSKVTHAMELVSASKMKKAQQAALSSRPYTDTLNEIIAEVRTKSRKGHKLLTKKQAPSDLIIFVTSNRGLVGGLNINLFRQISQLETKNAKYVTVGKKGLAIIARSGFQIEATFNPEEQSSIDLARTLSKLAINTYLKGEAANVYLLYPHFQSTIKQVPSVTKLLPITLQNNRPPEAAGKQDTDDLLFEPSANRILEEILPHHILTQIYQVLLEAKASEHSARMVAMKNATDAANDLIEDLTLTFNQARQEAITKELLDIITAQEAFE